jgi:SRSO17 transposase
VENCQVGVFLAYVTSRGHTLIDRELYLPLCWCEDADRRCAAHIPESIHFQTKPELATQMIERACQAHVPICWVVADTVYGGNFELRAWLEAHHYHYVLAVACTEPVTFQTSERRQREEAAFVEPWIADQILWHRLSMSEGTKGPRLFDWAAIPILQQGQDDGCHFLLLRKNLADPTDQQYYLVFAQPGTTLTEMVVAIGCRWHIEEDYENAKDMGLDHYEVRSFIGWYRHVTLVMLAHAFLVSICVRACPPSHRLGASGSFGPVLLPLSVPEVRHLLARLVFPASRLMQQALAWSWWRRVHQSWASYYHCKRRKLKRL